MTDQITAATEALNGAKDALTKATSIASETANASLKAVADSELAATASNMASGAASEIGQAATSLAKAGSKWAYIWMAQKMASQVLSTIVSIVVIIAIVYVVIYFMRSFVNKMREIWESQTFVTRVSDNIKHQLAINNQELLEDVNKNRSSVHYKVEALAKRVTDFETVLKKYNFEPLQNQLHDILREYKNALSESGRRMNELEAVVRNKLEKKDREHV